MSLASLTIAHAKLTEVELFMALLSMLSLRMLSQLFVGTTSQLDLRDDLRAMVLVAEVAYSLAIPCLPSHLFIS